MPHTSSRDQDAYLYDMLDSAKLIRSYMEGVSFDQFLGNAEKRDAVAMRIAAIGDAARNVTKATERLLPSVPFPLIRGMRNRIAHHYGAVDFREVWKVTQESIGPLVSALEEHFSKPLDEKKSVP